MSKRLGMRIAAGGLMLAGLEACDLFGPSDPKARVSGISCTVNGEDAETRDYLISVEGSAQGPVGSVLTPQIGKGTGANDPNKFVENINAKFFTGWSFGDQGDEIRRADGDTEGMSVSMSAATSQTKPVVAMTVYAYFSLVANGVTYYSEKTTTCQ